MKDILKLALQILIVGGVLLGLTFGGIALYKQSFKAEGLKGSVVSDPSVLTSSSTLVAAGNEYDGTSEAKPAVLGTSTTAFMADPITKTLQIGNDADEFCQNIYFDSSTTDAVLNWKYYFSDDGTNFYFEEDNPSVSSGAFTHGAATTTHSWTPAVTGAHYRQDCVDVNAKYIKIEYTRTANLSGGKLFSEGWTRTNY